MMHLMIPLADVGGAFTGITTMFVTYLGPILAFVLVIAGYTYMFALEDHSKAMQAKRAMGVAIVGAMVVALALGLVPHLMGSIGH